ncbi:hypothetical protein B0J13DRAFT_662788 [Dactylonectria estremocensis]|uniref:Fungal N-terminal domain-containing protein n=1 Tax=Dactylonectria estremocensis TaxID=1079267 RepID=A0A9P9F0M5_9HYPO|nr:hypothetical protein B0J13DRAFT_662788 [Dactylonectria estremocensis]
MADPLSIVASALTVAGAAITVADTILSFIGDLRNAPAEIVYLQNDVTDTRLILSNIKDNANEDRSLDARLALPGAGDVYGNPEHISKGETLIRGVERVLHDIDSVLRTVTRSRSPGRAKINQRAWVLNRSKLRSLLGQLRDLKTNAAVHFSVSNSTYARRSVVLLKRVLLENTQTAQQQNDRSNQFDAALQGLAQQLAELSVVPESQQQLIQLIENLNTAVITAEERSRQTTQTTTTETAVATSDSVAASAAGESSPRPPSSHAVVTTTSTTVSTESVSRLKLEFSRFQKRGCLATCGCSCHQRRRYKSPSFAQKVLGEVFIGFSSLPLLSKPCQDGRCTQRSPFSATFTYYLPTLFLNKMISLVFITTSQGDPAACVKVRPLSTDFSIYRAIERNDLQSVHNMVDKRLAHPSATFKGGWTPLHYAINYGHTAICKSLLAIGADPLIEDGWNLLSPLEWAWTKILGGAYNSETQKEMEVMFGDRECLEEMGFTALHRIVLGLNPSSLNGHISENPDCVNDVDSRGRTALSWAAQRGMVGAVKTLLNSGADPNICTPNGHSPLMYAAEARNPGCIQPLLDHGSDVTQCDIEGQTALHYAAGHHGNLAYYRPLMEANSDPNWPTIPRMTPLTTVILEGHNEAMQYLVEQGANINFKGHDDRSPAFYAVEYNNHAALRFLHFKGADFTSSSIAHPSIAHVVAHYADTKTLQLLTSFRLMLVDVDCVDKEGLSIPQIVRRRVESGLDAEGDFVEAFNVFLGSIRTGDTTRATDGLDEEDEFHDAMENLAT